MIRMPMLCAALALGASAALADDAMIIRGGENVIEVKRVEHRLHQHNTRRLVKVVTVEAEDRIVTLGKAMVRSGHSDRNDMIHVEYVHENLYLDPNKDYIRQNDYAFDPNSQIPAAQRLAKNLRANKAEIVFGSPTMVQMHHVTARPMMIIERPDGLKPRVIPSVPAPPKKTDKALVAMAK